MCKLCKADPDAVAGECPTVYGPGAYSTASASTMFNIMLLLLLIMMVVIILSSRNNVAL